MKKPKFRIKKIESPNGHVSYTIQKKNMFNFYTDMRFNEGVYFKSSCIFSPYMDYYVSRFTNEQDIHDIIRWLMLSDDHTIGVDNGKIIYLYFDDKHFILKGDSFFGYAENMWKSYKESRKKPKGKDKITYILVE